MFYTARDLPVVDKPMGFLAEVTGRNGETLTELPAAHRVLDGRAVELEVIKRRRGPRKWFEKVTWEIGPPSRELHTPGGVYLLLQALTARSRAVCGSPHLFCLWTNRHRERDRGTREHSAVFSATLHGRDLALSTWPCRRTDHSAQPRTGERSQVLGQFGSRSLVWLRSPTRFCDLNHVQAVGSRRRTFTLAELTAGPGLL